MDTFILMTKLSPDLTSHIRDRDAIGKSWLDEVKSKCPQVKFVAHYALLGQYDFMTIFEAPDAATAARVSLISRANGALSAESWTALPYREFLELTRDI